MDVLMGPDANQVRRRSLLKDLLIFGGVTFTITWLIVGAYLWDAEMATRLLGPLSLGAPAFYLAVYAQIGRAHV